MTNFNFTESQIATILNALDDEEAYSNTFGLQEINVVRSVISETIEADRLWEVEEAEPFEKATLAEIRILAETSSIHKLVLDKLPDSLAEDTMIYDDAYFFENVCEDRLIDIETLITEKYPFVPSGFLDNSSMEYVRYYYTSTSLLDLKSRGTVFEYTDGVLYRNEK